ncbi:MAG: NnrU family protein [Burkholderiales bacterium]|nr:NnrU family protein [Burkholderiales bacterium]
MGLLITGILLWSIVHLVPGAAPQLKLKVTETLGGGAYRAVFSALIVISLVCMVFGWRNTAPTALYGPADGMRVVTGALMLVALVLFFSSRVPTDIKRGIRHPQLTGVFLWAVAHLIANGDSRSLVLFGGLGVWAIIEMLVINRRDAAWVKPETVGAKRSFVPVFIGTVAWIALVLAHPWIAGVPAMPDL